MDEHAILDRIARENLSEEVIPLSVCFIVEVPNIQKSLKTFTLNTPIPIEIVSLTFYELA